MLPADRRRRLGRHFRAGGIRRPGAAGDHDRDGQRIFLLSQYGVRDVSGPDAGRDRRDPRACLAGNESRSICRRWSKGEWTGTMNLTEPHCGTDLGLLRTKAVKQADGRYKITGTKIFISAGEHDMSENIIHLVLARIEGAPQGTQRHLALHRAEVLAQRRRHAGRAQRGRLRLDRRENGHSRQFHLRDEL